MLYIFIRRCSRKLIPDKYSQLSFNGLFTENVVECVIPFCMSCFQRSTRLPRMSCKCTYWKRLRDSFVVFIANELCDFDLLRKNTPSRIPLSLLSCGIYGWKYYLLSLYVLSVIYMFDWRFKLYLCCALKQLGVFTSQMFEESLWDKIWKRKNCVIFTLLTAIYIFPTLFWLEESIQTK